MQERPAGLMIQKEPEIPVDLQALERGELPPQLLSDLDAIFDLGEHVTIERKPNGAVRIESENPFYDLDAGIKKSSKARQRIERFVSTVGVDLFLRQQDGLSETKLGRLLLVDCVLRQIAWTDPERALDEALRLREAWGKPMSVADLDEAHQKFVLENEKHKREVLQEKIDKLIKSRSAEAFAQAYALAKRGKEELDMKYVESDVEYKINDFFRTNFAKRKNEIVKVFVDLPKDFPNLIEIGVDLVRRLDWFYGRAEWDQEFCVPELLLLRSAVLYGKSKPEDVDRLYDQTAVQENRDAILAQVTLDKFTSKKAKQIADRQFDLYLEHNPALIGKQIDTFVEKYKTLNEAERERILAADPKTIPAVIKATGLMPSREFVDGLADGLARGESLSLLAEIYDVCGYVFDPDEKTLDKVFKELSIKQDLDIDKILPLQRKLNSVLPPDKQVSVPWTPWLERLESLQARTANLAHDPWMNELQPLMFERGKELDHTKEDGGEEVYEYVRQFGMVNSPLIFGWHLAIHRAPDAASIPADVRADMEKALGISFRKIPNKGFLYLEIKKFINRLQRELLEDKVPQGVDTPLGAEVLRRVVGSTVWARNTSDLDIVTKWRQTLERNPEIGVLSPDHRIKSGTVHLRQRLKLSPEKKEEFMEMYNAICDRPEVHEAFKEIVDAFDRELGLDQAKADFNAWRERAAAYYNQELEKIKANHDLPAIKRMEQTLLSLSRTDFGDEKVYLNNILSLLAAHEDVLGTDEALRVFSAYRMWQTMPANIRRTISGQLEQGGDDPVAKVFWGKFVQEYLSEHFLNPNHTKKLFDDQTYAVLSRVWRLENGVDAHPLCVAREEITDLTEKFQWKKSDKSIQVDLVPVKGLLRIFSGDIGDACYTSQHDQLADGQYPGITSYVFVTNRGTAKERIRGSVLFIETQDEFGRPVIVVRANNPQEGLIQQADSGELNELVLDAARELAARSGAVDVLVPLDASGMSSSNRPEVSKHYRKKYRRGPKVGLVNSPETNFNSYDIWNSTGDHALVSVGVIGQGTVERAQAA